LLTKATKKKHSLGTVSSAAVVDDSSMGTTIGMEHEPVHKVLLGEICTQGTQELVSVKCCVQFMTGSFV